MNLSAWALNNRSLIKYAIAVLMLAGVYSYTRLGQAEDPPFTFRVMVVRAFWPGATAAQMEQQVVDKLEKKLQETPWLDNVRSYSRPGESTLFVSVREDAPPKLIADIWYQVRKKLSDVRHTLPEGVRGPLFNDEFGDTYSNIYAFTADGFTYAELKDRVEAARQELLRIREVAKVDLIGAQDQVIYVEASNRKLYTLGISPGAIIDTIQSQNALVPSGAVEADAERVQLRVTGDFDTVENIRDLGLSANGRTFRLGDIANIYRGYRDPAEFKFRYDGKEAIALGVVMAKGGDVIALGEQLRATLERFEAELPVGIELHGVADQPRVVEHSIREFLMTLVEALVIVLGVSFLSLGSRAGIVVALSIPLVLAIVFVVMDIAGIDLQRISLGALIIALGLLVDDAIIAVEMMMLKMEQGWDRTRAATFAYTSAAFPMLTGTLITAAAFLPIGMAKSMAGEYTFSIFAVVTIALITSWVVAVLFTPYIGHALLPDPPAAHAHDEHAVYDTPIYRRLRALVEWCLERRRLVIAVTVGTLIASFGLFKFVEQQFFPASERPELMVDLWLPEGSSFQATSDEVARMEKILAADEDVDYTVAYVGGGSPRFYLPLDQQLNAINFGQLMVMTKGGEARERVLTKTLDLFHADFPAVRGRVTRLENGPPVGYPVQFRLSGADPDTLRAQAARVVEVMRADKDTRDVNTDWNEKIKRIRIDVDQDKARKLGVSPQSVSFTMSALVSGFSVTQYREGTELIDVVTRVEPAERTDLEGMDDIAVYTPMGGPLPLSQLARLEPGFEEAIIWRRNRAPTITVRADVAEGVQAIDVTTRLERQLAELAAALPVGYHLETGGSVESSRKSQASIAAVVPLMLFVIVTLLMLQLRDFSKVVLVLLTAPLGIIGVTLFLLVFQQPFGFVALLGVIALMGMIMRNSVILVDQIDQDLSQGRSPWDAIVDSTVRRARPIVLTALAAILAMIPLSRGVFWGPMAYAIMGGLLVATVLTLLFLPALYAQWYGVTREPPAQPAGL
jgi:multidrug efflux pump